jgi:hypothetical protein
MFSDTGATIPHSGSESAHEIGHCEDEQRRTALIVCRQTSYSALEARCKLECHDWDPVAVIREYLNPDNIRRETSRNARRSTNQRIYGEIGRLMEVRNRNDERRQANSEPNQAEQNQSEQNQAEQTLAVQCQAEQTLAVQCQAEQNQAGVREPKVIVM